MVTVHRSPIAYGTIKTANAVSVRCSADRSLIDFHRPGHGHGSICSLSTGYRPRPIPHQTAVARSSSNLVLGDPAKTPSTVRLLSGYCPANSNHGP